MTVIDLATHIGKISNKIRGDKWTGRPCGFNPHIVMQTAWTLLKSQRGCPKFMDTVRGFALNGN